MRAKRRHPLRPLLGLAMGFGLASLLSTPARAIDPQRAQMNDIERIIENAPDDQPAIAREPDEGDFFSDPEPAPMPIEATAARKKKTHELPVSRRGLILEDSRGNVLRAGPGIATAHDNKPEIDREPQPAAQATVEPAHPTPATDAAGPATTLETPEKPAAVAAAATDDTMLLPIEGYFKANTATTLSTFEPQDRAALFAFYNDRQGKPLWVDQTGFNANALALIAEIKRADDWGLNAHDYKVPALAGTSEEELTAAEVKLSLVALLYGRHARGFRIDNPTDELSSYIDRKPQLIAPEKLITDLADAKDKAAFLRGLHPKHPQFERLRQALLALRRGGTEEKIEPMPETGPALKPGSSHPQIAMIRERLKIAAPETKSDGKPADSAYYDAALANAVKTFKSDHDVKPATATITNALRRALNAGPSKVTEEALIANMEAWRWMPEDLGNTHVLVNVPEFLVRVVKDQKLIHEERIIAGRATTQTPIFSDMMRTVVFQPVWNVPDSIKVNELLPRLRAGGNPIARQGLAMKRNGRYVDPWNVDWYRSDIRNYYIYQPPGPRNVLGVVKFLFPNKHAVYLHDTPTKSLFNQQTRTYSHGCMRVRNPVRLAEVLLAEDRGWQSARVQQLAFNGTSDNNVALEKPIPVHVTYFTAWVDDDGNVKTFADVYGHEKRIALGLEGRWDEIEKNRDHLIPADPNDVIASGGGDWDDPYVRSYRRSQRALARQQAYKKQPNPVGNFFQQVFGF